MTVEVRPLTPADRVFYYAVLGGCGPAPVFVGQVDSFRAYGNTLDQVLDHCRQGLAHRATVCGGEPPQ